MVASKVGAIPEAVDADCGILVEAGGGEAAARLKEAGTFQTADFVFYNALFSAEGGYNSLQTRGEKIAIFQSALGGLESFLGYVPVVLIKLLHAPELLL